MKMKTFFKEKINFKKENEFRFVWMNLIFWVFLEYVSFKTGVFTNAKQLLDLIYILPLTSGLCWLLGEILYVLDDY